MVAYGMNVDEAFGFILDVENQIDTMLEEWEHLRKMNADEDIVHECEIEIISLVVKRKSLKNFLEDSKTRHVIFPVFNVVGGRLSEDV